MAQAGENKITFVWEGKDKTGRRIQGEVLAISEMQARNILRQQGTLPLKIKKKPKPLIGGKGKKIKPAHIAAFTRQLATMLQAGMPLLQGLEIIAQSAELPAMAKLVNEIKDDVAGGISLGNALARHPLYFDKLYVSLVKAGEDAGALEAILERIAVYKEKTESLKKKIKKALFYPAAVLVVAFIVTAILLIFVIPQFKDLFSSFGADLPAFTLMVIGLSEIFQQYWWVIFGSIGVAIYAFFFFKKRSQAFNQALDRLVLRLPLVGPLTHKAAIARFARTLSTMFAAGVPLVEAMSSVAGATGNHVYEKAVLEMRDMTAQGQQMRISMQQSGLFPMMVVQMVGIGEETGELDKMLSKVADIYEEEVDNMVSALSSLMEPMIMAFLGVVVGGLVIAMYLPIFKLGSVV
ncbi:type II secretion system F family protein [Thiofaba sp. EF100]|uniref:type II secretion system F family protein n=1 Tax=Thiofaba sp. EF100 TaxID=3121274 RepID=UPI00322142B4